MSDNVQYQIKDPVKVLLIMNEKMQLLKGVFMGNELAAFTRRKLRNTPMMSGKGNIIKTDKLAYEMEVIISLDELDNTDNLTTDNKVGIKRCTGQSCFLMAG